MKTHLLKAAVISLTIFSSATAQHSANSNYGNNNYEVTQVGTTIATSSSQDEMVIVIRGIYNEKATSQIATFSLLQVGKTAEETTNLMDERINAVKNDLILYNKQIEIITDMISFVPTYEYDVSKKIFNPKTYNEKPTGFELKRNLIIKYKSTNDLDKIMSICSKQEIYDLAKVDYISNSISDIRSKMETKSMEEFKKLISNYQILMNTDLNKKEKIIQEGYNVIYPMESYREYQAFSQADLNFDRKSIVNTAKKSTTQYYNGAVVKSHNYIMNPDVLEPTIQAFYDLTIRIKLKEDQLPKNTIIRNNRVYIVSPKGNINILNL